jgi:hypothetical protein
MIPILNFNDNVKGDTFPQKQITFNFDITNAKIEMQFKTQTNSKPAFFWSTEDNSIEIIDNINGVVIMHNKIINVAPAPYLYDCEIIFEDGTTTTYFGGTLTILQDITN